MNLIQKITLEAIMDKYGRDIFMRQQQETICSQELLMIHLPFTLVIKKDQLKFRQTLSSFLIHTHTLSSITPI